MKHPIIGIVFAALLSAQGASAEIFKCTADSGKVSYSDQSCASSQKSETVKIHAAPAQSPVDIKTAADYEKERQQKRAERECVVRE
jgi:hypothetical protein